MLDRGGLGVRSARGFPHVLLNPEAIVVERFHRLSPVLVERRPINIVACPPMQPYQWLPSVIEGGYSSPHGYPTSLRGPDDLFVLLGRTRIVSEPCTGNMPTSRYTSLSGRCCATFSPLHESNEAWRVSFVS